MLQLHAKTQVNFLVRKQLHDPWQRTEIQIKPKIALKSVDIGYPCWARKTRNSCHSWNTRPNTFPLDNQRASAWNINLIFLSAIMSLHTSDDVRCFFDCERTNFLIFNILKNNLQTWPLVILLNKPLATNSLDCVSQLIVSWNLLQVYVLRDISVIFPK